MASEVQHKKRLRRRHSRRNHSGRHIPHGLAYGPLGKVQAVVGFYVAVFPVFVYMIFATSRHISIGTFAVPCAVVGQIVMKYETPDPYDSPTNFTNVTVDLTDDQRVYQNIEIGAAVCLMVGLWEAALGLLKLGSLTVIMSESLVYGFTAGAAVQLKNLFGPSI